MRILITGGSGFIGTNLIQHFGIKLRHEVLNLDKRPPQLKEHEVYHVRHNILTECCLPVLMTFKPDIVIHLAARTDLDGQSIDDYTENTVAVKKLCEALIESSVKPFVLFFSTKLVFQNATQLPADTLYGQSKALGEKILYQNLKNYDGNWAIIRPTSLWGPHSIADHIPYGRFFKMVMSRKFLLNRSMEAPKQMSYVGNAIFQIEQMIKYQNRVDKNKIYYLVDYDQYSIRDMAEQIALSSGVKKPVTVPFIFLKCFALIGDVINKYTPWKFPLTSFRLKNMLKVHNENITEQIRNITGEKLPFDLKSGVDETVKWLQKSGEH